MDSAQHLADGSRALNAPVPLIHENAMNVGKGLLSFTIEAGPYDGWGCIEADTFQVV